MYEGLIRMVGGPLHNQFLDFTPWPSTFVYSATFYFLTPMRTEYGTLFWEYHHIDWIEP